VKTHNTPPSCGQRAVGREPLEGEDAQDTHRSRGDGRGLVVRIAAALQNGRRVPINKTAEGANSGRGKQRKGQTVVRGRGRGSPGLADTAAVLEYLGLGFCFIYGSAVD
jgi:hypothetical protein